MRAYITRLLQKGIKASFIAILIFLSVLWSVDRRDVPIGENEITDKSSLVGSSNTQGEVYSETVTLATDDGDYEDMPSYTYSAITITIDYTANNYGGVSITAIYYANDSGYDHTYDYNGTYYIPETLGGKPVTGLASNIYPRWDCWNCRNHGYFRPKALKLNKSLVRIENSAFSNEFFDNTQFDLTACTNLEYVGNDAFYNSSTGKARKIIGINENMDKLTTIGTNGFRNAFQITYDQNKSLKLPNIVTIGANAFYDSIGIKSIELGDELKTIGNHAFYNCNHLEDIYLTESIASLGTNIFENCANLLSATVESTFLSEAMFKNCTSLSVLMLSQKIKMIPRYAFYGCSVLSDVKLASDLTEIQEYAFYSNNFNQFTLPDGCTTVGQYAFASCEGIRSLDLNNVENLGDGVFAECTKLEAVIIPETVKSIGVRLFEDCSKMSTATFEVDIFNDYMFSGCTILKTVNLDNGPAITKIPAYCFNNCPALAEFEIITTESEALVEIGEYAFYNTAFPTISLTKNQATIGEYAFAANQALKSVNVDVVSISDYMFYECPELTTVVIGSRVNNSAEVGALSSEEWAVGTHSFAECDKITSITFNNNVIGDYMFYDCEGLVSVTIPEAIEYMGTHAFSDCVSLNHVDLLTINLGQYMFAESENLHEIVLSSKLVKIPAFAFYHSYLTSITIPASVTYVGESAFEGSIGLRSITINNAVIGEKMFKDCISLPTVSIPSCDTIGVSAFEGCVGLETLDLSQATKIGEAMFKGCTNLASSTQYTLVIPSLVNTIGASAFENCLRLYAVSINSTSISANMFKGCATLNKVTINSNVSTIGSYAFANCTSLVEATLNNAFTSAYMFSGCTNMTKVTFSQTFRSIGEYSFAECINVTEIDINSPVFDSIGSFAFLNCESVINIVVPNSTTSIAEGAFNGCIQLASLTLPFVGSSRYDELNPTASKETVFGYIFGTVENEGSTATAFSYSASASYTAYIPNSLLNVYIQDETVVQYGAFSNLKHVASVVLSDDCTKIEDKAFYNCDGLNSLSIPASVITSGNYIAAECDNLKTATIDGTIMGKYMFQNNVSLEVANLLKLHAIPAYAFDGCSKLHTVNLNQKVDETACTTIEEYAFRNCLALVTIILPNSIQSIGQYAFYNCEALTLLVNPGKVAILPTSLATLGQYAFAECSSLTRILFPENLVTIGTNSFENCTALFDVKFQNSVIGQAMFKGCTSLLFIDLNDSTTLLASTFEGCTSLEHFIIPESVTSIGNRAFFGCTSLVEIIIPAAVTSVGTEVFRNCTSLVHAYFKNSKMGANMFNNCTSLQFVDLNTVDAIPDYAFYIGRNQIIKMSLTKTKVRVFLAVDPANYPPKQFPHRDVSNKKAHSKTPFLMMIKSNLSLKRVSKVISDIMTENNCMIDQSYKEVDYVSEMIKASKQ